MRPSDADSGLSDAAVVLLDAVLRSAPIPNRASVIGPRVLVRYLSATLDSYQAEIVERSAVDDPIVRGQLGDILAELSRFRETVYGDLVSLSGGAEAGNERLEEWLRILDKHVETVSATLTGPTPTTWPALARLAQQGLDGFVSARTIWRALFVNPNVQFGIAPLQLGFGYRRGSYGSVEPVELFTRLEGIVRADGALEIEGASEVDELERAVFLAFSMNGRALPLAEATIHRGRVKVVVEGLGAFLRLPAGPIPANTLAARFDDWPENCKLGQLVVEAANGAVPLLEMPIARNGELVISGYFEDPRLEGKWHLLLAATPNSWQMLAQFDIKCVSERPQALTATLPATAREGPFGGALLLRLVESRVA